MPAAIKIRINGARGLPVMDRATEATDAYVTINFADTPQLKTGVCPRTLTPSWNQEFRIEIADDCDLQDYPLVIKCWDRDIMSSDNDIGALFIDLNPLLNEANAIQGWYPLYDTLRGIRGELSIGIKMDFIGDVNPFKESGAGVQFCSLSTPPAGCRLVSIIGLVEELIVTPDPEYHFLDSFRTARISNERRRLLMYELSGKLRRQMGRKVLEAGGNAVLAFSQVFDLEGETSAVIVARGIGTSVKLRQIEPDYRNTAFDAPLSQQQCALNAGSPSITYLSHSPSLCAMAGPNELPMGVMSPPSHVGSAQCCGNSFSSFHDDAPQPLLPHRAARNRSAGGISEVTLLTMAEFPLGAHMRIAGVVSARSVKLFTSSRDTQGLRDTWWNELREEIRAHARSLSCAAVVGYSETANYQDELVVLSATGTAAYLKLPDETVSQTGGHKLPLPCAVGHTPYLRHESPLPLRLELCGLCGRKYVPELLLATVDVPPKLPCLGEAHLIQARVGRLKKKLTGESHATAVSQALPFLEYDLHRQLQHKLKIHGKNALFGLRLSVSVGETLMIASAEATGVCVASLPLTPPLRIRRNLEVLDEEDKQLVAMQRQVEAISLQNQALHQAELAASLCFSVVESEASAIAPLARQPTGCAEAAPSQNGGGTGPGSGQQMAHTADAAANGGKGAFSVNTGASGCGNSAEGAGLQEESSDSSADGTGAEAAAEGGRAFVVEVDDEMDEDMIATLLDPQPPTGLHLCSSQSDVGGRLQSRCAKTLMMTMLKRIRLDTGLIQPKHVNQQLSKIFDELQATLAFKVRRMLPLTLFIQRTQVSQPTEGEVEVLLTAQALQERPEDGVSNARAADASDVELTPLSFVPGASVRAALGPLCLFLIKETWTLREEGGIANFCHAFVAESHALVRAHIFARGGNVALDFRAECKLTHQAHKNHAYCLIFASCDAAVLG